ncbi:MAG: sulfatase-like hydrolase/transferase [Verrucomicrobiaceae bacterium]|nr:sulfatase-like hydrolase/transferase [Verrucomicrobiaceae bacterium]
MFQVLDPFTPRLMQNSLFHSLVYLVFLLAGVLQARVPNVVLILADDLGYADLGCYGAEKIRTPHLDGLAAEGMRFTGFYVSQAVCSASRASLMTGCYANRVGMQGALNHTSREGIHADELLLPEMLHAAGYATAAFGKWHLGTRPAFHPMVNGFDEFLGIPYSNDNSKYHPSLAAEMPPLPLYDGKAVVETDPDQSQFTRRFTERAVSFITRNKERPFFLYLPHVMPHVPIFASAEWRGKSAAGLYGDVVEELDASVGRVLTTLREHGLEKDTLVIFFSDNGPFLSYGNHAGSAAPLREGKLTSYEGGVRVPCLMRWPGHIPAGKTCAEAVMEMDLLPTLAALCGGTLSKNPLDGKNILPLLEDRAGATSPHEALFFYSGDELQAVRSGRWKLHFAHSYISPGDETGRDGKPGRFGRLKPQSITQSGVAGIATRHGYIVLEQKKALYDLQADPGEKTDLSAQHPEIVSQLEKHAEAMRADLGDSLTKTPATGARPLGRD